MEKNHYYLLFLLTQTLLEGCIACRQECQNLGVLREGLASQRAYYLKSSWNRGVGSDWVDLELATKFDMIHTILHQTMGNKHQNGSYTNSKIWHSLHWHVDQTLALATEVRRYVQKTKIFWLCFLRTLQGRRISCWGHFLQSGTSCSIPVLHVMVSCTHWCRTIATTDPLRSNTMCQSNWQDRFSFFHTLIFLLALRLHNQLI